MRQSGIYVITLLLILVCFVSFWANAMSTTTPNGPYMTTATGDHQFDITWNTASATVRGNTFTCTGKELVLVRWATGAVAALADSTTTTYTLHRSASPYGLSTDVTSEIFLGETQCYWINNKTGWENATGEIEITSSTTNLEIGILRITR